MGKTQRMADSYAAKVIIAGDGAIGKTCLISRINDTGAIDFDSEVPYEPTTFNNFQVPWSREAGTLNVELWDTAGQEAFEALRKLSYPGTDIYIIGYSCVSDISLQNVVHKWVPEIKEAGQADDPWIVLCGCKCDRRTSTRMKLWPRKPRKRWPRRL